ncbi:hypothetical protein [Amycolatopsis orientalis]|uniref:hypothetical protein n=1 Tax=Amycolatopsis orientalis TaxID=31958 RepID=UPI0011AB74CB|nr:hypothetical protein [Amycolatopsis orientalis]
MRFTLTYSGRLPASSKANVKHQIRQNFHPQLKELWRTHPALESRQNLLSLATGVDDKDAGALVAKVAGLQFAALVHPFLRLYAELDILVLRPETPGAIVSHSGDIDNQLKTLFDALRRPVDGSELPVNWKPTPDEQPLHCLLDDDKLITRVNIETDRLLKPDVDPKDVEVTIRVTLKTSIAT